MVHLAKMLSNGTNSLLISDGVGVGKTIAAGYIIYYINKILGKSVVVLCPPVLIEKWRQELKLRFDLNAYHAGQEEEFDLMNEELANNSGKQKIYLIAYSMLKRRTLEKNVQFGLVVMDEVHHSRNPKTQLYSALSSFCTSAEYRIGLSATPVQNNINDLASIMSLIVQRAGFEEWRLFINEIWKQGKLELLSPFVTKFTKNKLGLDFTKRRLHQISVEYPASYVQFVEQALDKIGMTRGSILSAFERTSYLRLASSSPNAFFHSIKRIIPNKYPNPKIDKLLELIDQSEPGRWIIFTEFRKTAELLKNSIKNHNVSIISGDVSFSERYLSFDEFRKNENTILVMMPVGSEGLDLQVCARMINFDLHWNPMVLEQRIGRIDRLGQNKPIIEVYNFVVNGSIDQHIMTILRKKVEMVDDTFASTEDVLGDHSSILSTKTTFPDSDLDEIEDYIKMLKYYSNVPVDDYLMEQLLSEQVCKCESWRKTTDWLHSEILTTEGLREITNRYLQDSIIPLAIIDEYSG